MDFEPSAAFLKTVQVRESELDLTLAALEIARDEYPELETEATVSTLEALADRARTLSAGSENPVELMRAINISLFSELGLSGNDVEYYDPRNSYLNDVLERKVGIPIALSAIYLDVGWRLGVPVVGVSFPGHFLVKCHMGDSVVVIDPFHRGLSLDEDDLLERLRRVTGDRDDLADFLPRFLGGVSKREILGRMLRNLKGIFVTQKRFERALGVCNKICLLFPDLADEVRDRGQVYEELDCFSLALEDYRRYLNLAPTASDVLAIKQRAITMEGKAARLN
jgi:regulator of sirC expression with transglutaminase-like and TPR domain